MKTGTMYRRIVIFQLDTHRHKLKIRTKPINREIDMIERTEKSNRLMQIIHITRYVK